MFFSRDCNRGKSKLIVQDYEQFIDEEGQTKVKRVRNTVRLLAMEGGTTLASQQQDEDGASSSSADTLYMPDDSDCFDVEVDEPGPSHYEKSSASAVKHWQEIRVNLIKVSLKREGLVQLDKECNKCKTKTARMRCLDCGGSSCYFLCESCCISLHRTENIFHCPEIWKDGKWEQYILTKTFVTSCFDPDCAVMGQQINVPLTLIDEKGIHHEVLVPTCSCATIMETLVYHRFWPATPCSPTMAFSFDLLLRLQALMFECHISVYDFVKHLSFYNRNAPFSKTRNIYEQLRKSFEEFRYHLKAIESVPVVTNDHLEIKLESIKCPSCPDPSEKEDVFLSADACFGLPRKRSAGESFQDPLSSDSYFLDQNEVDKFMDEYPKSDRRKSDALKDRGEDCSDFQAGSVIRSKGKYVALDETAVFGVACRHAFPLKFLNLKGGERIGYMVYMLTKVVGDEQFTNNNIKVMYDICCQLDKHLKNHGRSDLISKVELACPQFHAYAHGADCQMRYSPRRLPGWGLCDGEVMERLWSYLGKFKKMTKEMSSIHRQDILTDALHFYALHQKNTLVTSIIHRHKSALKVQKEALDTIKEIQEEYSSIVSSEMVQQWLEEEKRILIKKDAPKVTFPQEHEWIMEYFQLLRKFYALRENVILQQGDESCERHMGKLVNQLLAIEKAHKIPIRWKPTDREFQNTLVASEAASARSTLNLLLMSGRRRWFLLSLVKKYADGQAQAYRIIKAVTKESKNLKSLLKKYNASVQILKEHGRSLSTLSWEEVTNVASSSLYSSTRKQCDQEIVPDAIKREVIDAYNLCQRAGEELSTLYQEMSRIMRFFHEECKDMEERNEVTLRRSPDISITLWAGQRSVLLRKLHLCQRNLFFFAESFKALMAIPTSIDDYLKNSTISINIPYDQLMNEMDECDQSEDVKLVPNPLEFIIDDEKGDYLFGDDNDSGFVSACDSSIPPDLSENKP